MEHKYRKPGKARGSTVLPGKKPRLLAMSLMLAVLAGGGFAIGEEKDVSGQARQQDAESKDIQLDGPIRPSAIITKEGVVIPKYEDEKAHSPEKQGKDKKNIRSSENGNIVPNLQFIPPSSATNNQPEKRSDQSNSADRGNPNLPYFYSNFQIEDAKRLEQEYMVLFLDKKPNYKRIREEERKYKAIVDIDTFLFPDISLSGNV